jgi:hypothetical protein
MVLLRLKLIIGLLKFRTFSSSRKGSIKSGSHFSAKLTKKHGFPNKIRATDVSQLLYFLLLCGTSTHYDVHTSALDGASKSQTEYFDTLVTKRFF